MPAAKEALTNQWKHRLEQWHASGQTIAVWCRERAIAIHVFYYWRKKIMPSKINPVQTQSKFVELFDSEDSTSGVSIDYYGITVRLAKDFHPESLLSCLKTLRRI